jgi:hypothetical protein
LWEARDEPGQLEQVLDAEGRPTRRDHNERIRRLDRGPVSRERGESALIVMEVDARFAPVLAIRHQSELAAAQRMKRVRDPEGLARTVPIGCS